MTQMSDYTEERDRDFEDNSSTLLAGSRLARAVHDCGVPVGVLLSLVVAGCVFPPRLSVDNQDAGVNSPPAITVVRGDTEALFEADPANPAIFTAGEGTLNVSLVDTDENDTLYVRVFVNYTLDNPFPARATCTATPVDMVKRSVTCDVSAVCVNDDVISGDTLNMTVHVFDRQPLESGEPRHQAMPPEGLSSSKFYFLTCQGQNG